MNLCLVFVTAEKRKSGGFKNFATTYEFMTFCQFEISLMLMLEIADEFLQLNDISAVE